MRGHVENRKNNENLLSTFHIKSNCNYFIQKIIQLSFTPNTIDNRLSLSTIHTAG